MASGWTQAWFKNFCQITILSTKKTENRAHARSKLCAEYKLFRYLKVTAFRMSLYHLKGCLAPQRVVPKKVQNEDRYAQVSKTKFDPTVDSLFIETKNFRVLDHNQNDISEQSFNLHGKIKITPTHVNFFLVAKLLSSVPV